MARRITRTLTQAVILFAVIGILVFLADSRYDVLPDAIHAHLPSHHSGSVITDITISYCSSANPLSKCRLDSEQWHRIEKDLYLHSGWVSTAWLHVKRRKEEELTEGDRVVIGMRISSVDPGIGEKGQEGERWESRPGGIWILRSNKRHASDSQDAVTAVDVLFGADVVDPRLGWTIASTPLLLDSGGSSQPVRLSVRRGQPWTERKEIIPRVSHDGRFKILQVSDLHLSTGVGACRDAIGEGGAAVRHCEADPRSLEALESVLDDERPDLVVFSGDQVEGPAAWDPQSAIFKFAAPLIERSIPYATIFGNHDDEGNRAMSRAAQMSLIETLPYSLSSAGPVGVEGIGNYVVEILAPSPSQHSAITLYLLDTHGLSPDEKKFRGYDWLKPGQIDWFRSTHQRLQKDHARYSHIHLDMAFIHIPLPEFADQNNIIAGGSWKEGVTAPGYNTHFYDALAEAGVVAVGCGHDHVNDYCALRPQQAFDDAAAAAAAPTSGSPGHQGGHGSSRHGHRLGPWMCYAGGAGFGGYAGYGGFHRRMRVWDVDTNAGRVLTWKRVECCGEETRKRIDELIVVEGGKVVAPS